MSSFVQQVSRRLNTILAAKLAEKAGINEAAARKILIEEGILALPITERIHAVSDLISRLEEEEA